MSISFNAVLFFTILIILNNSQYINSTRLLARNQNVSPCCQQQPYFTLFSYSPCACPPPPPPPQQLQTQPTSLPVGLGIKEIALKPFEILAGTSHLALGTILKIGGTPFKLVGTLTKNGGEFAETFGYGLKTTGAQKVTNGVSGIANFLQKFSQPTSVICVVKDDKINIYQPVEEKEKVKKVAKTAKVARAASPCCQQPPYFTLFSYSPCACPPPPPQPTSLPVGLGFKEIALKPFEILAGASHLALGTILNIGGTPFKLIGTLTKNGGEFAEVLGYDLKTTGAHKVTNGVSGITNLFQKFSQPTSVICVVKDDKINIYQHVQQKEKVDKVTKVDKVHKVDKVVKMKVKPTSYEPTTVKYEPTTVKYEPTTVKSVPTTVKYEPTTVKYEPTTELSTPYYSPTKTFKPLVTTPYLTKAPATTYMPPPLPVNAYDLPYEGDSLTDEDD